MKITAYTPENCKPVYGNARPSYPAQVSINYKAGQCTISKKGQERLEVKQGDKVQLGLGTDLFPYIRKAIQPEPGFTLMRPGAKTGKSKIAVVNFKNKKAIVATFPKPRPSVKKPGQFERLVWLISPEPLAWPEKWYKLSRKLSV